ncbi:Uncharacterised protein [uncultured archaeon]|nr:Uncharacterised protein [uncultured archaeon]
MSSNPIIYTLIAPSTEGNYTISGTFKDDLQNTGIVTGATTIKVGASLVSSYDVNGNGRIDKDEAIQAVMDYFRGGITRQEAIEIVTAYFSG